MKWRRTRAVVATVLLFHTEKQKNAEAYAHHRSARLSRQTSSHQQLFHSNNQETIRWKERHSSSCGSRQPRGDTGLGTHQMMHRRTTLSAASGGDNELPTNALLQDDEDTMRRMYTDWRKQYHKDRLPYEEIRFQHFCQNYQTLQEANRRMANDQKSVAGEGPVPEPMTLNQYGDYSMQEFRQAATSTANANSNSPSGRTNYMPAPKASARTPTASFRAPAPPPSASTSTSSIYSPPPSPPPDTTDQQAALGSIHNNFQADSQQQPASQPQPPATSTNTVSNASSSYYQHQETYQDQYGRPMPPPRPPQPNTVVGNEASSPVVSHKSPSSPPRGTIVIDEPLNNRYTRQGTQVIDDKSPPPPQYGTKVIKPVDPAFRGTEVVKAADPTDDPAIAGTQVIRTGDPMRQGTKVIKKRQEDPLPITSPQQGTQNTREGSPKRTEPGRNSVTESTVPTTDRAQGIPPKVATEPRKEVTPVLSSFSPSPPSRGTQVVEPPNVAPVPAARSTLVIPQLEKRDGVDAGQRSATGTQVVNTASDGADAVDLNRSKRRSTMIINEKDGRGGATGSKRSTILVNKLDAWNFFKLPRFDFLSWFGGGSDEDTDNVDEYMEDDLSAMPGSRGTVIVKRQMRENPIAKFFGLQEASVREAKVMAEATGTQVIKNEQQPFTFEVLNRFKGVGGTAKPTEEAPRTVRGTIVMQSTLRPEQITGRKTVLIQKEDLGGKIASVFSFFGGSKSREDTTAPGTPYARPTLVLKLPNLNGTPNDDNKVAQMKRNRARMMEMRSKLASQKAEVRALRQELQTQQSSATSTRKARPTQKNVYRKNSDGIPIAREVEEVRQWKQNADGSISGLIYNSQNFNDGTEVTTSPVPMGCRVGLVTTRSGAQYLLK